MEKGGKGSTMIRMGVSGWMFLLVPAYPGCPGSKAVKRSLLLLLFSYRRTETYAVRVRRWCCCLVWHLEHTPATASTLEKEHIGLGQTDGRTDGQTDTRPTFYAFHCQHILWINLLFPSVSRCTCSIATGSICRRLTCWREYSCTTSRTTSTRTSDDCSKLRTQADNRWPSGETTSLLHAIYGQVFTHLILLFVYSCSGLRLRRINTCGWNRRGDWSMIVDRNVENT